MAQSNDRRRYGYTDGSLAYDLDALARERALDDAGRMEPQRREPVAAPRRQSVARPAAKLSPLVLACAAVLTGLVVVLLMGYVRLTEVSADISQIKTEMGQLEERHVALLTQYEKTGHCEARGRGGRHDQAHRRSGGVPRAACRRQHGGVPLRCGHRPGEYRGKHFPRSGIRGGIFPVSRPI